MKWSDFNLESSADEDDVDDEQAPVKKPPTPELVTESNGTEDNWTDEEKKRLLEAIEIYGNQDLERLKESVKSRSVIEILQRLAKTEAETKVADQNCPDTKLKEWGKIAEYVISNRRDYSNQAVKKLLQDKFWDEERRSNNRGGPSTDTDQLHLGRIYLHLSSAIDGKNNIPLTDKEKLIMRYLIYDLGKCVQSITNMGDMKGYFENILGAYRRKALTTERTEQVAGTSSDISVDALCSLNPFCVPNSLLIDVPRRDDILNGNGDGTNENGGASASTDIHII